LIPGVTTVTLQEITNSGSTKETLNQRISSDGTSKMTLILFAQIILN